jgi:hypothetical protein
VKSNKPTKQEFCLKIEILKKKYPNKNIIQFLADDYRIHSSNIYKWLESFGISTKEVK